MLLKTIISTVSPREHGPWTPPVLAKGGPLAWLVANLAVAALYFVFDLVVSQFFAAYGLFPAPIWLPASVAMIAAMVGEIRLLPGIFLGSFLANALLFGAPAHVAAIISITNALGPVIAAILLRRSGLRGRLFTSFAGVGAFLFCTTLLHPAITATGGTFALALGKPLDLALSYSIWVGWWLSDSGGTLYLACALILWLGLEREPEARTGGTQAFNRRDLAVWGAVAVASLALFLTPPLPGGDIRVAFPFLLVVPLSWIALRMSLRSAYTLVSLVAVAATAGTVAGVGPFQDNGIANPLGLVGILVVLLAMNVLTIVALVSERHEAESANKVKAMFLAKTSHELRTPLNAIIGFSSLIDRQALGPLHNEEYASYARLIQSSGEHLLALINDLLEMSKIEAGHIDLREERFPLAAAIDGAITLVEVQAAAKSIALHADVAAADVVIEADAKALRQVLLNVLSNAVKFTPEGGSIDVAAEVGATGELAIAISDTGIGIPADALQRLFTPFERAPRDATRRIEGTGLGLSIAKGLVSLHAGTIRLSSVVGAGTTVTITLPASRVVSAPAPVARFPRPRVVAG